MTQSHRSPHRKLFLLDPSVTFLNHGSFGATPRTVFRAYQQYQLALEREPVDFLGRRSGELLAKARADLAAYLGAGADDLVYVTNATTGMNMIAHSLELSPGDEVLATNHEYGAVDRTWHFYASKLGFTYINRPVPLPVTTPEEWIHEFWRGVSEKTKVIAISHITSPTALIFPIAEVCRRAREKGILTVIDGAHAPGQIPLNLADLKADFYTGNLHKWLCAPKGAAFLYANPSVQHLVDPLVVSWGYESSSPSSSSFIDYNQWTGTRDIASYLAVPDAIQFIETHAWQQVRERCNNLAGLCVNKIGEITGLEPLSSDAYPWYAQMVSARLPASTDLAALSQYLWVERKIEVPVLDWNGEKLIRVSFQAYNDQEDLDTLCAALRYFYS